MARDVPPDDGKTLDDKKPDDETSQSKASSGKASPSKESPSKESRSRTCKGRRHQDGTPSEGEPSDGDTPAGVVEEAPHPDLSPIDYLTSIYRDESVPRERRMDAAKAVVAYVHPRMTPAKAGGAKKPPRRIIVVWGPPE